MQASIAGTSVADLKGLPTTVTVTGPMELPTNTPSLLQVPRVHRTAHVLTPGCSYKQGPHARRDGGGGGEDKEEHPQNRANHQLSLRPPSCSEAGILFQLQVIRCWG